MKNNIGRKSYDWYYINEVDKIIDIQRNGVCFNCDLVNTEGESLVSLSISFEELEHLYNKMREQQ